MPRFFDLNPDSLQAACAELGLPRYVAAQLLDWVYAKGVVDLQRMTNLSKANRALVAERFTFYDSEVTAHQVASDGTEKLLLSWGDAKPPASADHREAAGLPVLSQPDGTNRQTECVMIPTASRRTACVSSQVGCPVG